LKIRPQWHNDGPMLPIEFSRISTDDRVTLIIDQEAQPIRTYWAAMTTNNIDEAVESLRMREVAEREEIPFLIKNGEPEDNVRSAIHAWLSNKDIDAAVWTGLDFSAKTDYKRPGITYILDHLHTRLRGPAKRRAEKYIRKAPKQTDTAYRRIIERELGWTRVK